MIRTAAWFTGVLALLILFAAGGAWLWLRGTLPATSGVVQTRGIAAAVEIVRDGHGIPVIHAQNACDGYFALGYVHAQDRLFQMDMQRRYGAGRLAEIVGAAALPVDREMRVYGFYRLAEGELSALSPEFLHVLDCYAAGVNAWLGEGHALPVEFALLRYRPDPWRPADSLVIGKLLALQLSGNMRREIERATAASLGLTPAEIGQLVPGYPKDAPVSLASFDPRLPWARMLAALPPTAGPTAASNNWVVDGRHSMTGKPILANDPHLDYGEPGTWYLARLEAPGMSITGGTIAGAPLFVLGHNRRIAWGYTTDDADVEDLFVEKLDPKNAGRYLAPQGSLPFDTRVETIHVKGAADDHLTVRATRHGPVISDLAGSVAMKPGEVVALAATFLMPGDTSLEAQWRVDLASNWAQFVAALRQFVAPAQNIVYADVDGNIGFYVPARIPIRAAGDGTAPVPGWTGAYDWRGFIPFEQLPQVFDPPGGRVFTANNKIVPDSYPYLITHDWDAPFRAERIAALLAETPKQSVDTSAAIQRDDVSMLARALVPYILAAPVSGAPAAAAHKMLAAWDDRMALDRPEPLLFTAWRRALDRRLLVNRLGDKYVEFWDGTGRFVLAALQSGHRWCVPAGRPEPPDCNAVIAASLDDAIADLGSRYGADMTAWRWGAAHQAVFAHPLFSRIPILDAVFGRRIADDGADDTVHAGGFAFGSAEPYADRHGPGLRAVYDLARLDQSVFMEAPGQVADVLSPWFDDLLVPWQRGDWLAIPEDSAGFVLRLEPAR